jgi:carbonic anhydrase
VSLVDEIRAANERYAATFEDGSLPVAPGRALAVVTCMDSRIDPLKAFGLELGDAHVIRNAGGIVNDEVLRSLVISHHLLGTQEAVVVGHTNCGMVTFENRDMHERLGPASHGIDFQPFPDVAERVRESVAAIHASPLLPGSFTATGFVFHVENGRLEPVT